MVGELERLGPDGTDAIVLGVDASGFADLPTDRKIFAYYLYRAAIAGDNIMYHQNHRDALEIKDLLEAIVTHSEGMAKDLRDAVLDYLKYIWIHHGQYHHYSHVKFLPNKLTPEGLREAARYAVAHGAKIETRPGETLEEKLARLERSIFDPSYEPIQTNQSETDDPIATSAVNFFDPGITQADLEGLLDFWKNKLNVRFALVDGRIVPQVYRIGGLYSRELETVSHFLRLALPYAENEEQGKAIQALLDFYATGDEALFREHSIHWLRCNTVIDFVNGFVEQYMDPRGIIGNFEANVSYKAEGGVVEKLAQNALYFEKRMPWPDRYKRSEITPPVVSVVNVITETGDAGPVSPAAYNLPNYNDIRRDYGSKNVILLNIERSRSRQLFEKAVDEFYLPEYRKLVKKYWIDVVRPWEVYMHEVIGHGSGQPDPDLPQDPRTLLGRTYSALEECRADLVALYHIADPKLPEIGAFPAAEQEDITLAMIVSYLQGWLARYDRIEGEEVREAHNKGSQLILMYLVENGGDPNDVVERKGKVYVKVRDVRKAREGIGELLGKLQVIKSTSDRRAAEALFDRFGTKVNLAWKSNIVARKQKLRLPKLKAFVFPRLVPVLEKGELVDVKILHDEDLATQHLRFSRMQYSTEIGPF
jgi:dipeptidyl-peptidase-3